MVALVLLGVISLSAWVYGDIQWLKPSTQVDDRVAMRPDQSSVVQVDELVRASFFGQQKATDIQPSRLQSKAPETRLKLELKGVFSSTNANASSALIAEKNQAAKYYRVGDELPGGAILNSVASDHVKLKRNGIDEALSFMPSAISNDDLSSDIDDRSSALEQHDGPAPQNIVGPSSNRSDSLRERLRQLRDVQKDIERQGADD